VAIYVVVDFLEAGLPALLDLGLAFAAAGLAVLLVDLDFALTAAAFAATFLASFFVLVVFLTVGFLTVAAFLVVVAAFFVEEVGFLMVEAFSVVLVLLTGAFFAGVAFCLLRRFLRSGTLLGGLSVLLGIGRDSWPLRSKLNLTRGTFREDKGLFLSSAGESQVELMKI